MKLKFDMDLPNFDEVSDRGHARAHKAAGTVAATFFIKERIPHRFDGTLKDDLHWAPRDERYEANKRRRGFGAGKPHFYTGSTASKFKRATPRVTRQFVGAKVNGLGPQYNRFDAAHSKNKGGAHLMKLRQEIARLTSQEGAVMAKLYAEAYVAAMTEELRKTREKQIIR